MRGTRPAAPGRRRATTLLVAVLAVAVLLTGCGTAAEGGPPAPRPDPTSTRAAPSPTPSADGTVTAEAVRGDGVAVAAGDAVVVHALPVGAQAGADVRPDGDITVLTVDAGAPATPVAVLLAAPPDGTLEVQDDGSLVVLAADGTFVGGAARPVTVADGGPVRVTEVGDGVVRASVDDGDLQVRVGARALAGAEWGEREGGRSLAVAPTPWARAAGQAGEVGVWTELVSSVPEADTAVMRDQLTCHVLGAPDKETWNLEPWRPDVGLLGVLAAACNPT